MAQGNAIHNDGCASKLRVCRKNRTNCGVSSDSMKIKHVLQPYTFANNSRNWPG
jgi:hypothetical protein